MNKFFLIGLLSAVSIITHSQSVNVEGRVKFIPNYTNPSVTIQVFEDGNFKKSIFVESDNPYRYKGKIVKSSPNGKIELKVTIGNPSDYGVDPSFNPVYHYPPKKIVVRKLVDIAYLSIERAREHFNARRYEEVIKELSQCLDFGHEYSDGQTYYMSKILADSYRKIGQTEKSIAVLKDNALELDITNSQKFETYRFLSSLYAERSEYENQRNILKKLESNVNLTRITSEKQQAFVKERYDNLLKVGSYNTYTHLPSLQFSQSIAADSSAVSFEEWSNVVETVKKYYQSEGLSAPEKSAEKINIQVNIINEALRSN